MAEQYYGQSFDRTRHWVQHHTYRDSGFYSPTMVPTPIEGYVPSPPSDSGSAHSNPPKMVLRYNDGRPDIPIPRPSRSGSNPARPRTVSQGQALRGGSRSGGGPLSRPAPPGGNDMHPEEIRVLPSLGSSRPSHHRSRSVPRPSEHEQDVSFPPPMPQQYHGYNGAQPYHPQPQQRSRHHSVHQPPVTPQYVPQPYVAQGVYNYPPQVGPNGVMYSHSAPVPGQFPPGYAPTGYATHERGRSYSTRHGRPKTNEDDASLNSESTYFVVPTHGSNGHKLHVIVCPL